MQYFIFVISVLLILFNLSIGLFNLNLSVANLYYLSVVVLGLSTTEYFICKKLHAQYSFLKLPLLTLVIFSLVNIFYLKTFKDGLFITNYLMASGVLVLWYLLRTRKRKKSF